MRPSPGLLEDQLAITKLPHDPILLHEYLSEHLCIRGCINRPIGKIRAEFFVIGKSNPGLHFLGVQDFTFVDMTWVVAGVENGLMFILYPRYGKNRLVGPDYFLQEI